jgi:hypothetical protein
MLPSLGFGAARTREHRCHTEHRERMSHVLNPPVALRHGRAVHAARHSTLARITAIATHARAGAFRDISSECRIVARLRVEEPFNARTNRSHICGLHPATSPDERAAMGSPHRQGGVEE